MAEMSTRQRLTFRGFPAFVSTPARIKNARAFALEVPISLRSSRDAFMYSFTISARVIAISLWPAPILGTTRYERVITD